MRKLIEHTDGNHIYMMLELDGKTYEIDNYAGLDASWEHFKTTADNDMEQRAKVIAAFRELY